MSNRIVLIMIAIVLMQALLLTQVDFTLAVMPGQSTELALHQKPSSCVPFLAYQLSNQTAYVNAVLALAPHMPASGLTVSYAFHRLIGKESGQFFASLTKHISEIYLKMRGRVLVDSIPRTDYIWAYSIEAIGPPRLQRLVMVRDETPNC